MSTVFENIISGTWPGRFEWADDVCVTLSTIEPIVSGHVLVIPRHPYPKWTDAPDEVLSHLMSVAAIVGRAQESAFKVPRSGLIIAGFEVPHTHLHVVPMRSEADLALRKAAPASDEDLDRAAEALRTALREDGYGDHVPTDLRSPALG